jgi:hypothetical protein
MRRNKISYRALVGNAEGKRQLRELRLGRVDWIYLAQDQHGNKPLGSAEYSDILE